MTRFALFLLCVVLAIEHILARESTCCYTFTPARILETKCLRYHACVAPSATAFRFFTTELVLYPAQLTSPATTTVPLVLHRLRLSNRNQPITKGHHWHVVPAPIFSLLDQLTLFDVDFTFSHDSPIAHLQLNPFASPDDPNSVDGTFLKPDFEEATSVVFRTKHKSMWHHLAQMKHAWLDRFNGTVTSINTTWMHGVRFPFRRLHRLLPLDHLESLALFNCTLRHIHPKHLLILPRLTHLEIVGCGLSTIHPEAFNPTFFPRLEVLNISRNNLVHIPASLGVLPSLAVLDISGNKQRLSLPGKQLLRWGQLEALSLRASNISLDSLFQLQWLAQLRYLDLAECALQVLPAHIFSGFNQLLHLDLSLNYIQALDDASLAGLQQLRTLDISKNALALPPKAKVLTQLPHLQHANLDCNWLESVPLLSSGARNVSILLSNNRIRPWNEPLFTSDVHLEFINLSHNDINVVTLPMVLDMGRANRVAFHANPFDCSSHNFPHLHEVLHLLPISSDPISLSFSPNIRASLNEPDYLCAHPAELRTKPVLSVQWPYQDPSMAHVLYDDALAASVFGVIGFVFAFRSFNRPTPLRRWHSKRFRPSSFQFDAFVCYSSANRNWVAQQLVPHLENTHPAYRLCLYERNFSLGVNIVDNIWRSLLLSRRHVFLVSEDFLQNPWCQYETEAAEYLRVTGTQSSSLIFVVSCEPTASTLNYLMDQNEVIPWPSTGSSEEEILWRTLRRTLGPPLPSSQRLYGDLIEVGQPVTSPHEPLISLVLFECL